tara:strand:- start:129 stop:404 length:276 start_codon:yes stop_codon:yes gene_type:complete
MGIFFNGIQFFFPSKNSPQRMTMQFRQDSQDDRVWALEVMLRHEGFLDPRIYECAQMLAQNSKCDDAELVVTEWERWKKTHKAEKTQVNRL